MSVSANGRAPWDALLAEARKAHQCSAALSAFCPFPDDISAQDVLPFHVRAAELMAQERRLFTAHHGAFRDAFVTCGPLAQWRETYKETDIGQDFMDRFACYCLIGEGGAFHSATMAAWVVYMPPNLHYPWHHHPAEELYFVIAGEARFWRGDAPPVTLGSGETIEHGSDQPHAMETGDHPVMAYVVWRNGFDTPPMLGGC